VYIKQAKLNSKYEVCKCFNVNEIIPKRCVETTASKPSACQTPFITFNGLV